jgi:peptide/nickel transport system substrate-binding protein
MAVSGCKQQEVDAIRFGLSTAPVTLDPRFATDAVSHRINRLLYQRLVDFDENYHMVPVLADWEQLNPLHYRFTLIPAERRFHNGDRLTAKDVKATYDSVLDAGNISPHRATLTNIDHIEVIDDGTVDFYLENIDPLFPGRLGIGILPEALIKSGHPFNRLPVGSGELKFYGWPAEETLVLQRLNDGEIIEFITVKDSTVRVLKLLRGEIDLIQGDLPFELMDWLRGNENVAIESGPGNVFTYIGFNMRDPALADLNVRRAIAHAINRDDIIKYVLGSAAHKTGTMLPPGHWSAHPGLAGYEYDPEKAKALLELAGYGLQNPLKLGYKTSNNPLRVRLATIIQYQLKQAGIYIDVQSYDWGTFYGDIKDGRFQMFSLSWVGLKMPDIFRYVFHSTSVPPDGANRGRYTDAQADMLIETAEKKIDLEEQAKVYRELQVYLQEQLPYVPLWYEDNILARRKEISGYVLSPDGNYDGLKNVKRFH